MSKFRASRERDERGFTLIELLVVILIIAILAAIAIPVFLRQREKGWVAQTESALKNAATATESYATGNQGEYTGLTYVEGDAGDPVTNNLTDEGYTDTETVTLAVVTADATSYCISATHDSLSDTYYISSESGKPSTTVCT